MPAATSAEAVALTTRDRTEVISREREDESVENGPNNELETTPMTDEKELKKKPKAPLDSNIYSTKKTVAQGMMDIALLTANASQLKMLIKYSENNRSAVFAVHITFLSISLLLQVIVGVLLIMNSRYNINQPSDHSRADLMNNLTVVGIFLITVVNVIAASFGESL